jgi:signal transduction histidine kinase
VRDVSDRKLKELKIVDQNRSLLKIAHLQAHEFRAPLTSVIGIINLIRAEDQEAPWEYYEQLENAVHNLDIKIKQIVGNVDNMALLNITEVYG